MINKIKVHVFRFETGDMMLGEYKSRLCMCDWLVSNKHRQVEKRLLRYTKTTFIEESTPLLENAAAQLGGYFTTCKRTLDLPFVLYGTPFQIEVWNSLCRIPYGKTVSYGELAESIGRRNSVRAVAAAVGANPMSILIPCHRVIGSDGALVGYAGSLPVKRRLLAIESGCLSGVCQMS